MSKTVEFQQWDEDPNEGFSVLVDNKYVMDLDPGYGVRHLLESVRYQLKDLIEALYVDPNYVESIEERLEDDD